MANPNWHPAVAAAGQQKRPLETHQAAERLNCSSRTIRRLCEQKILPGLKVGRRKWLIPASAIDEYIESLND